MSITENDVRKIAKLARIRLSDQEIKEMPNELSKIMQFIEQLQEVTTDHIEPLTSVSDMSLPMDEDEATDGGYVDDILKNAPKAEYNCFLVPKVIE